MTEADLQKIIDDIKYKDWELIYSWNKDDRYMRWLIPDRLAPNGKWSCRHLRVSVHMTRSEIIQTAFMGVQIAEEHETREHFLYKGVAVLGPHIDLEQLVGLMSTGVIREDTRK